MAKRNNSKRNPYEFLYLFGNKKIIELAREYADTPVPKKDIADKYNLSTSGLNNLFEYGIVNDIIPDEIVLGMKSKAHSNQLDHMGVYYPVKTRSDKYYLELLQSRLETLLDNRVFLYEEKHHLENFSSTCIYDEPESSISDIDIRLEELQAKINLVNSRIANVSETIRKAQNTPG